MPTKYKGTIEQERALNTFIKLTRACNSLASRLADRGTLENLTESQFGVLETLFHLGPKCQGELSQKLLKSTGNMTMVIDNLERNGLVRRERSSEDRRMVTVNLTPAGCELIQRVFPYQVAAITDEMRVLTPDEQEELGRLCKKLGLKDG